MGMSTHVVGFVPPDEKWRQMKSAWDACEAAGVPIPVVVTEFFKGVPPDERGVEYHQGNLREVGALTDWKDDMREGFEVHVDKIPKHVKVIRFYNSW